MLRSQILPRSFGPLFRKSLVIFDAGDGISVAVDDNVKIDRPGIG